MTDEEKEAFVQGGGQARRGFRKFAKAGTVKHCACGQVIHPLTTPDRTETRCVRCRKAESSSG